MSAPGAPDRPRPHRPRTVLLLGGVVVLAALGDLAGLGGQAPVPAVAVPLAAPGCPHTSAVPAADAPSALPARVRVDYRPDAAGAAGAAGAADASATTADGAGARPGVSVAAVVESVGHGVSYDVGPCQSVAATLYGSLPDGTTVHGAVAPGRRAVVGDAGGRLLLVDSATGARTLHGGREGFEGFSGWYGVVADPVPGTYSWSSDVVWRASSDASSGPGGPGTAGSAQGAPVGSGHLTVSVVLGGPPHVPGGP